MALENEKETPAALGAEGVSPSNEGQAGDTPVVKPPFKDVKLTDGRVARIHRFKGLHIRKATRDADGDTGKMMFCLIAATTTIDGKNLIPEDLDEMDGEDVLLIQGAFTLGGSSQTSK